jgi:hypothetical protein
MENKPMVEIYYVTPFERLAQLYILEAPTQDCANYLVRVLQLEAVPEGTIIHHVITQNIDHGISHSIMVSCGIQNFLQVHAAFKKQACA